MKVNNRNENGFTAPTTLAKALSNFTAPTTVIGGRRHSTTPTTLVGGQRDFTGSTAQTGQSNNRSDFPTRVHSTVGVLQGEINGRNETARRHAELMGIRLDGPRARDQK